MIERDVEHELEKALDEEVAKEFMLKYKFTVEQRARVEMMKEEYPDQSLTTCVLDVKVLDDLFRAQHDR